MRIAYVKTHEAYDRCHVVRDGGTQDAYRFHAYRGALPHELVHFAVEVAFGLRRGVWGCVAAGVDLARANDHANRRGGAEKSGGPPSNKFRDAFGDALPEVLYSEALTTIAWSAPLDACVAAVEALGPAREAAAVSTPTLAQIEHARALVSELRERWLALGPREALHLEL